MNLRQKVNAQSAADNAAIRDRLHYKACNGGPCNQGRGICPSPEACRLPDDGSQLGIGLGLCAVVAVAVCAVAVMVFA